MNRRMFLGLSGGAAAAGLVGGLTLPTAATAATSAAAQSDPLAPHRTLVVVDMQGGNDALNTLVPQTGLYRDIRPGLAVPESELLTFAGLDFGVHPSLAPLERFWDDGNLAGLYGVGLQGQGRSHFVAQDAWRSAMPGEAAQSGWIGRWLEATQGEVIPTDSAEFDPTALLRAIALGQSTLAAQGEEGRPVAIQSVEGFQLKPPGDNHDVTAAVLAMGAPIGTDLFSQAQAALPATVDAVRQLQELVAGLQTDTDEDAIDLDGDRALFHAAQAIIQGNLGTKVIFVTINGFDTHSLQAAKQTALLELVADGLSELFEELEVTGHAENTLAMVVSEFGRRASENGSQGTDHGQGGLSFLLGPPVDGSTVIGEPDLGDLDDDGLRISIDTRQMYNNALRWLGATESEASDVLYGDWNDLQLLRP